MNARLHTFEIELEGQFVEDYASVIFHTILFNRTSGKFRPRSPRTNSYSIDSLSPETVDCKYVDFPYVRCASEELGTLLQNELARFQECVRSVENHHRCGQISLEFYQKKKNRWPFADECSTWEVWTVKTRLIETMNEAERQKMQEAIVTDLCAQTFYITEAVNVHTDYLPKTPNLTEMDTIFDLTYPRIQPYLFKITHTADADSSVPVGTTVKKFFKDVAAM